MAESKIIRHISEYIKYLNLHGISVSGVYLYGSYSVDKYSPESDIDVLIVTEELDHFNDILVGKIWKITKQFDEKIEPVIVGKKKFHDDEVSPLLIQIKREGIQVI